MPELVFYRRNEELMRIALDERRLTIGRGAGNDIDVPDPGVSRSQLALYREDGQWWMEDLSGKGTERSGQRTERAPLSDGDDLGLGQWRALFLTVGQGGVGEATRIEAGAAEGATLALAPGEERLSKRPALQLRLVTDGRARLVPLEGEMTIGSGAECSIQVDDPFISSRHLSLRRTGETFHLRDLGSRNGTFLGAARLWEAELPLGCALRIGETALTVERVEAPAARSTFEGMVGSEPAMRSVFETIERVAPSNAPATILGESGTGKELVARALHRRSARHEQPFIPVNCGALNKELIDSELFGHEKGAFTGAERQRKGAFEEAHGGTLFLDEIGELPLESQARLLRAIELGEVKRVGASRPIQVDVRIVAATNRELRAEVARGAFREDLYWRLCVIPIMLPPLRARRGDLRALIEHVVALHAPPGSAISFSPAAWERLLSHQWPGNVRELKNVIHRSLLLRRRDLIDEREIIFGGELESACMASEGCAPPPLAADPDSEDLTRVSIVGKTLEQIEDEIFVKTCKRIGTRATFVARELGQSRGAAYRRMERLGISPGEDAPEQSGPG